MVQATRYSESGDFVRTAEFVQWSVLKAVVVSFEGQGINDPVIITSYNIASLTRVGIGEYQIVLDQLTMWGMDITSESIAPTPGVYIPGAVRAIYCGITPGTGGSGTAQINVAEWVVGSGNKMELVPYDLEAGETVDIISFLLPRNDVLPPA